MDTAAVVTIVFALLFPVLALFAISRLSGWKNLATQYPRPGPAPKALTIFGYGSLRGWIGYNGGLILAADGVGLYISTWPILLSWCHAPVFIPWSQILEVRPRRMLWSTYYHFSLKDAPEIDFALSTTDFKLVRPFLEEARVPVAEPT